MLLATNTPVLYFNKSAKEPYLSVETEIRNINQFASTLLIHKLNYHKFVLSQILKHTDKITSSNIAMTTKKGDIYEQERRRTITKAFWIVV